MTEQEIRALVRDVIARQGRGAGAVTPRASIPYQHPSHGLFVVSSGADGDGPCIIEPAVPCNHCGYCKSYGH